MQDNDSERYTEDMANRHRLLKLWRDISSHFIINEDAYIQNIINTSAINSHQEISKNCKRRLILLQKNPPGLFQQLLQEYNLGSTEGLALMALAEALLRTPDMANREQLILDKLISGDWEKHRHQDHSIWLTLITASLNQTSHWLQPASQNLLQRLGLHTLGLIVAQAITILGKHFVFCEKIQQAKTPASHLENKGYSISFDMLGEAALSQQQANDYLDGYHNALQQLKGSSQSLSIKLSALHPRFEANQQNTMLDELYDTLLTLIKVAAQQDTAITLDAEEQDKLEITRIIVQRLLLSPELKDYHQLGLAVQAYGKRATSLIKYMHAFCEQNNKQMQIRLVKGAYWDSEIKQAQQLGLDEYPVFTQKSATDLNYLHCVDLLFNQQPELLYPMFATHNAHTCEAILYKARLTNRPWEFQRLHGMGEALYESLMLDHPQQIKCCVYAPVGNYKELLPYLVRRLIENGANSSFVFQSQHKNIDALIQHPLTALQQQKRNQQPHLFRNNQIPLPVNCLSYQNSTGPALYEYRQYTNLSAEIAQFNHWQATPLIPGYNSDTQARQDIISPNDQTVIGSVSYATTECLETAIQNARDFLGSKQLDSKHTNSHELKNLARLLEKHQAELVSLCIHEAGKTLQDAIDEIREAIDFCRYYQQQQQELQQIQTLDSIAGEKNLYRYKPRGIVLCISPWNFPLAIFIGQIAAALATGNAVLAKPSRQTNLIAYKAVKLIHQAGFDIRQCQLLPGSGAEIADSLLKQNHLDLICITGSTHTARDLQLKSLEYNLNMLPIIAETGGQNVLIADSTCLLEDLVKDVIQSAFASAGQRCSALRVAYIQEDIFEPFCTILKGAMCLLVNGNSCNIETDIGPIIDNQALVKLQDHLNWLQQHATLIAQSPDTTQENGFYLAPSAWQIDKLQQLTEEHFGPVLHLISYKAENTAQIIKDINNTGYGLTLGLQSRNQHWLDHLSGQLKIGNIYINRNMIGAKVGAQPFGGTGLSGTGPKAGGPNYLKAFCNEHCISQNLMAIGGDTRLLNLE